jgi:hypothetical protein
VYARNLPPQTVRALVSPRFAATALISLAALFSAACSEPTSPLHSQAHIAGSSAVGSASSSFTVLANASITCTNGTIGGNVGTFMAAPLGSVTATGCPITGTTSLGEEVSTQAFNDFLSTYTAIAPKPEDACTALIGTLAGVTLSPGVYCFNGAATLTGVLTLDGPSDGIWKFTVGTGDTGALAGTGFSVVMAGGAQACNVTWWVAQAATLTDSNLVGSLLGGTDITLTRGTFSGNASARGDLTITGTAVTSCGS